MWKDEKLRTSLRNIFDEIGLAMQRLLNQNLNLKI